MIRLISIFSIISLLSCPIASPAAAQQIILDGIEEPQSPDVDLPTTVPAALPARRMHEENTAALASAPRPTTTLLPLRTRHPQIENTQYFRLRGQFDRADFVLFLPHQIGAGVFQLTSRSAINVLPERSEIEVLINGTSIGLIKPEHFDADRTDFLDVPAGLFVAGQNQISLHATQVHRVLCGPEAAFSLWTDISLGQSGVEVALSDLSLDPLGFLAATAAQLARSTPYSIHISGAAFSLNEAASIIARVQDIFAGTPPSIVFEDYYSVSPDQPMLARVMALPPDQTLPGGPEIRRGGDGAVVLMVNSGRYDEVARLLFSALNRGENSNVAPSVVPGQATTLASMGQPLIEGRGQYLRAPVSFRLPRDWLLLASQKAELHLDYQYDTNLPQGAVLLIKINNSTIRLLPLDDQTGAGHPLETLRIPFATNLLKPGLNRLDFETLVPGNPPDQACAPRDAPTFQISGTSSLFVPRSPAMSMPSIDSVLDILGPNDISMSDAALKSIPLGILPQLAAVYASAPNHDATALADAEVYLTIGVVSDLSSMTGDVVEGYATELQSVLLSSGEVLPESSDPWLKLGRNGWWSSLRRSGFIAGLPRHILQGMQSLWRGPTAKLDQWILGQNALAMLIQPDFADPGKIWLILPSQDDYSQIIAALATTHREFEGPHGQISLFMPERGWVSWTSPDTPLKLHEALTLGNIRAVLGNYVTVTPSRYVLPLMLLTLCSAIAAIGVVILTRRRKP